MNLDIDLDDEHGRHTLTGKIVNGQLWLSIGHAARRLGLHDADLLRDHCPPQALVDLTNFDPDGHAWPGSYASPQGLAAALRSLQASGQAPQPHEAYLKWLLDGPCRLRFSMT